MGYSNHLGKLSFPASDPRVHFGLGSSNLATSIQVQWPSGISQTLTNIKADQQVQVDEPLESDARPAASH